MIVVTGSKGFIGTNVVDRLIKDGHEVVGVDKGDLVDIDNFSEWWENNGQDVSFMIHLGAITDTTCTDEGLLNCMNTNFSKVVWLSCLLDNTPLIYASSAATYGDGSEGYSDDHNVLEYLEPLNLYAKSKHLMDKFAICQKVTPPKWYGLKFFNVYGYNESRKGRMASMVHQGHNQILQKGVLRLFEYGHHKRDFVYVKDIVNVILWLMENKPDSGIYNIGTGESRSFNDLANILFDSMKIAKAVEYIPMPEDLKDQYQEFTQADISKLRKAGYDAPFHPLEYGISEFLRIYNENNSKSIQQEAKK